MALTSKEKQQAFRARKKAAGLIRLEVWIPDTAVARAIIAKAEKRAGAKK